LSVAAQLQPDLLLLDIGMPGTNGYELACRIRKYSWAKEAVMIAITGWGQEEDRQQARAAGFDDPLTKPIDPAAIQSRLREIDAAAV
jgi:two-component system, chemotaxis family, CheB/CheR fusion protein